MYKNLLILILILLGILILKETYENFKGRRRRRRRRRRRIKKKENKDKQMCICLREKCKSGDCTDEELKQLDELYKKTNIDDKSNLDEKLGKVSHHTFELTAGCPKRKIPCDQDPFYMTVKDKLDNNSPEISTSKDKYFVKKALNQYKKECEICMSEGKGDYECINQSQKNFSRRLPLINNVVYPWKNFDWDYRNFVDNNYSPKQTGASVKPTIDQMYVNVKAITKVLDGMSSNPIPNDESKAGIKDLYSDYPEMDRCEKSPECKATQKVKALFNDKKPYDNKFLNKNLIGRNSSSYYFKVGDCPRDDIKSSYSCERNGYTWIPDLMSEEESIMEKIYSKYLQDDSIEMKEDHHEIATNIVEEGKCYQPRYGYINNSSKPVFSGSNAEGLLPSAMSDIKSLSPDNLMGISMGFSAGDLSLQKCPIQQ